MTGPQAIRTRLLSKPRKRRIEFVNLAFESLTGLFVQDSVGKNFASLAEAQTSASDSVLDTVLQRGIHHKATELRRKDGSTLPLECAIVAVRDRDGSVANLVYAGRDLTQERALQPELAQARNLQTVATLAGGAAHDFNNLLMVISAYAELALHTLYNEHPLRRNLQEILEAARRATDLTRQLLVFGRKQVQGLQPVELNSIIKDASQMLSKVLGEDIELQLSLQKDLGPVEADPGQLDQVLLNLTVNARDAMPDGGKLVIQTQTVSSDDPDIGKLPTSMREFILLSVTDSGVGIPAEQLLRIFDPFFTTKAEGKGTGLGLGHGRQHHPPESRFYPGGQRTESRHQIQDLAPARVPLPNRNAFDPLFGTGCSWWIRNRAGG